MDYIFGKNPGSYFSGIFKLFHLHKFVKNQAVSLLPLRHTKSMRNPAALWRKRD